MTSSDEFDINGMDELLKSLDEIPLTRIEKSKIVEAGADVVKDNLIKNTKALKNDKLDKIVMDFKKAKGGRYEYQGHLYSGVTFMPNEYIDGSTDVGFQKGYITVAHWLNNGTYRQPATYFLTRTFDDMQHSEKVVEAQTQKAQEIIARKGL